MTLLVEGATGLQIPMSNTQTVLRELPRAEAKLDCLSIVNMVYSEGKTRTQSITLLSKVFSYLLQVKFIGQVMAAVKVYFVS